MRTRQTYRHHIRPSGNQYYFGRDESGGNGGNEVTPSVGFDKDDNLQGDSVILVEHQT